MIDRRLRLASSSPDVKALFNGSPSYISYVEEEEDYDQPNYIPGPATDYWASLAPIVSVIRLTTEIVSDLVLAGRVPGCPLGRVKARTRSNAARTLSWNPSSRTISRSRAR